MPRLVAALYDPVLRIVERQGLSPWRAELLARARGRVLEVGAGTGLNLPHYSDAVEKIVLTEPDPHMRRRLERRADGMRRDLTIVDAVAAPLPFDAAAFDTVVMTLVLCTVPDVPGALAEVRRVLRAGGALLFLEHVGGREGSARLRWQRRFDPAWRRLAGGCHLSRHTVESIKQAGFAVVWQREADLPGPLRLGSPVVRGEAKIDRQSIGLSNAELEPASLRWRER